MWRNWMRSLTPEQDPVSYWERHLLLSPPPVQESSIPKLFKEAIDETVTPQLHALDQHLTSLVARLPSHISSSKTPSFVNPSPVVLQSTPSPKVPLPCTPP